MEPEQIEKEEDVSITTEELEEQEIAESITLDDETIVPIMQNAINRPKINFSSFEDPSESEENVCISCQ